MLCQNGLRACVTLSSLSHSLAPAPLGLPVAFASFAHHIHHVLFSTGALAVVPQPLQPRSNSAALRRASFDARLLDAGDVQRACSLPPSCCASVQLTCARERSPDPVSRSRVRVLILVLVIASPPLFCIRVLSALRCAVSSRLSASSI